MCEGWPIRLHHNNCFAKSNDLNSINSSKRQIWDTFFLYLEPSDPCWPTFHVWMVDKWYSIIIETVLDHLQSNQKSRYWLTDLLTTDWLKEVKPYRTYPASPVRQFWEKCVTDWQADERADRRPWFNRTLCTFQIKVQYGRPSSYWHYQTTPNCVVFVMYGHIPRVYSYFPADEVLFNQRG